MFPFPNVQPLPIWAPSVRQERGGPVPVSDSAWMSKYLATENLQGKEAHPDPRNQKRPQMPVEMDPLFDHPIEIDGLRVNAQLLQLLPPP